MSAAFECVERHTFFHDLGKVLGGDILYLTSILVNNTRVRVKTRGKFSDPFITNVGVAQGDCFSAILFNFYLACSLLIDNIDNIKCQIVSYDHVYSIPKTDFNQQDHCYSNPYGYSPRTSTHLTSRA